MDMNRRGFIASAASLASLAAVRTATAADQPSATAGWIMAVAY